MALLDNLLEKAKEKVTDPTWVEKAVESGKKQTDKLGAAKPVADAALDEMLANKDKLSKVSGVTFTAIVSSLALGRVDEAKLLYLRQSASFDELMGALDAASDATRKAQKEREEAWAAVKEVALDILKKAGSAAIPLLLAAI